MERKEGRKEERGRREEGGSKKGSKGGWRDEGEVKRRKEREKN